MFDLFFDPFTFGALVGIAVWLDRRVRSVENKVAYERGFEAGRETALNPSFKRTSEKK